MDRKVAALDDLDKLQHGQAWARTGAVFGTDEQKQTIADQLEELGERVGIVQLHLQSTTNAPPVPNNQQSIGGADWPRRSTRP